MYNFHPFSKAITDRFNYLSKNPSELYVTATTTSATRTVEGKDELYEYYLNSFPADTNPMFRTRREYFGPINQCLYDEVLAGGGDMKFLVELLPQYSVDKDGVWSYLSKR